jgi:hypothetical protein
MTGIRLWIVATSSFGSVVKKQAVASLTAPEPYPHEGEGLADVNADQPRHFPLALSLPLVEPRGRD